MKQMSYVTRWLYSTSHKDIGILYLGFGMLSAMIGTGMSVIIRMELSNGNSQFFHGNNQAFNVIISGHALLMIFFFVMPVWMGAFGNNYIVYNSAYLPTFNKTKNENIQILEKDKDKKEIYDISINKSGNNQGTQSLIRNKELLGSYLAGLIEGDGSISVHDSINKNRYSPIIIIAFKKEDYPLVKYLQEFLQIGTINDKKTKYYHMTNKKNRRCI